MSAIDKLTPFLVAVLLLGAGSAIAGSVIQDEYTDRGGITCEIREERRSGSLAVMGSVSNDTAISGSYRMRIKSASNGGRIQLQQGGEFHFDPDRPEVLGQFTLGSRTADYEATLEVYVDGEAVVCSEPGHRFL
jgi:hypothetical protein